ncbi:MAG: hypothetical protein JRF59_06195 [Deltaproteobacteria bacterium]|nr:hypothetical protein [Deltaproteobacteria bacterium]
MKPTHAEEAPGGVKIVRATSTFDCGGRCPLRLHVKDNRILRVESAPGRREKASSSGSPGTKPSTPWQTD